MAKPPVQASCHCGAVRIEVARKPRKLTQCNCSICRRYGTLWAYYTRRSVRIEAKRGSLVVYAPRRLRFCHCATCGCITHYETPDRSADGRIVVNARMMDQRVIAMVPIKVLDGDATWKVLDEYTQPEIFISPTHL